jgi:hypothetical protein
LLFGLGACSGSATSAPRVSVASSPAVATSESPIVRENRQPGTTGWLLTKVESVVSQRREERYRRQLGIEGFVSHTSIRAGEVLTAYVSTQPNAAYEVEVFRLGYYGGAGGRSMRRLGPFDGQPQPEPVEAAQQLIEARWQPSFELEIPADWQSGVYLAKLTVLTTRVQSYLIWVVKDERRADVMFQVSDLTWQAYNRWPGGHSLYDWKGNPWYGAPGPMVSFDRPYGFYYNRLPANLVPKSNGSGEFLLWEMPLVFWLEEQGYDVTYVSGLDTHQDGEGLLRVKAFLSVGHDEYWSRRMFDNVVHARDAGVSLAFLSGNAVDGEISLHASSDGRVDRRFERSPDRGASNEFSDEHELMGATSYGVGLGDWITRKPEHWLFAGTDMAAGDRIVGLVGWEYQGPPLRQDPSLVVLASGAVFDRSGAEQHPNYAATIYDGPKGNLVFNAASCWWSMLLSAPPGFVNPPEEDFARSDPRVQRMTQNLIDRMIRR